jgi:hypothetical protein
MVSPLFLRIRPETRWRLGLFVVTTHIATAAGHTDAAARTGVLAFPGLFGMVLANPSTTIAEYAFHGCCPTRRGRHSASGRPGGATRHKNFLARRQLSFPLRLPPVRDTRQIDVERASLVPDSGFGALKPFRDRSCTSPGGS